MNKDYQSFMYNIKYDEYPYYILTKEHEQKGYLRKYMHVINPPFLNLQNKVQYWSAALTLRGRALPLHTHTHVLRYLWLAYRHTQPEVTRLSAVLRVNNFIKF